MLKTWEHNKISEQLMDGVVGHDNLLVYDSPNKWMTISDDDVLSKGQPVVRALS